MLERAITLLATHISWSSAIHGPNPKVCARPGSGHWAVLTNLVRCCLDQWVSGSWISGGRCSHGGAEASAQKQGVVRLERRTGSIPE
jgi:hypothetical protein